MKLQTRLIIVFFLLTVVPLGGFTLFSYLGSINAFRQAVERETEDLAVDMGRRVESVHRELRARIQNLQTRPFFHLLSSLQDPEGEMKEAYETLVQDLGEAAEVIEKIELETMSRRTSPPGPQRRALPPDAPRPPLPPMHPGDSVTITFPGMMPPPPPQDPSAPGERGYRQPIEFETPGGGRFVMEHTIPPPANREARAMEAPPRAVRLAWIAEKKRARKEALEIERRVLEAQDSLALVSSSVEKTVETTGGGPRIECLDLTSEIPIGDQMTAKLVAQVNARKVFESVLSRTLRKEGEIPFVVDNHDQLHALSAADLQVLEELRARTPGFPQTQNLPGDWLVVSRAEETTGVIFGIARPLGAGLSEIRTATMKNLGYGMGLIGLAMLGILPLSRRMTRNLSHLTDHVDRLAQGNLDVRIPVRSEDEFGQLSEAFNKMAEDLKEHQHRLVEQERIKKELEMGRQIQTQMLPKAPLRVPFAEVQGVSIPAREVGGDFFNYFPLTNGDVALLIGDVSGKGVAAALLMANIQATLRARLPLADNLVDLAHALDQEIGDSTPGGTFTTLFLAVLEKEGRSLRWLSAGHNTQYVLRGPADLVRLPSSGRPLGLLPGSDFQEHHLSLDKDDTLFLYTDGLVEAESEKGEEFGNERLEEILSASEGGSSLLIQVEEAVRQHRGAIDNHDDATMVVLKMAFD